MSERLGIEIDYCPQCRGVWLDRGELDKIIERSTRESAQFAPPPASAPTPQAPYPSQHHADQRDKRYDKQQGYRKKSIWEELFD
jgi:Zn-finger nucleic acid-binding protein